MTEPNDIQNKRLILQLMGITFSQEYLEKRFGFPDPPNPTWVARRGNQYFAAWHQTRNDAVERAWQRIQPKA